MARAVLELVITDSGPPPVGAPAPSGIRSSAAPTAAGSWPAERSQQSAAGTAQATVVPQETVRGGVSETLADTAKTAGVYGLASAVVKSADSFYSLTDAINANRLAQEQSATETVSRMRERISGGGGSGLSRRDGVIPISSGTDLITRPNTALSTSSATETIGQTAQLTSQLGPAALAVAAFTAAATAGAYAAGKVVDYLKSQADNLSKYSPELAGATAQSDIRDMLAEMRRAQRVGPELANVENLRSRFETGMTNLTTEMLKILSGILRFIEPIANLAAAIPAVLAEIMKPGVDALEVIIDVLTLHFGDANKDRIQLMEDIKNLPKHLNDAVNGDPDPLTDPFTADFFEMGEAATRALKGIHRHPVPHPVGF
jgi:hypothetical protein